MAEALPPTTLPVFPLTGSLLLPGTWLPLNIFETRYRNMVEDALAGGRYIGMIQPRVPRPEDNRPDPAAEPEHPELYEVGCAGHIERAERQPDGRYLILLKGIRRFRVRRELPPKRDYRRVEADFREFAADTEETLNEVDPEPLLASLDTFADKHQLTLDMERLRRMPGVVLLNGLAVALPFAPAEKQALLEAEGPAARQRMLLSLIGMGIEMASEEGRFSPPTLN